MVQTLTFPGLGLELELNRVAFYMPQFLGGFAIYWYGILIATAFLAAILYATSRTAVFGVDRDRAFDIILLAVMVGMLGARVYYVVFSLGEFRSLKDFFSTRGGGLAIYGGVIFGVLSGVILCRIRRVQILPMLDLCSGALLLGQAIGRWGNFVNIEAFGSNTGLPWGMSGPAVTEYLLSHRTALESLGVSVDPSMPVHPTFLYESIWCLLGFALIHFTVKRRRFDGQLALIYLLWYGFGRFFIEGLRTDSLLLGGVRVSQMVAMLCVLAAGFTLATALSRLRREDGGEHRGLYVHTEEGQAVVAGTFYKKVAEKSEADAETQESGERADAASEAGPEPEEE